MRQLLITLTYRVGVAASPVHLQEFESAWTHWCEQAGFSASLAFSLQATTSGRIYWFARTIVPSNVAVPYLDRLGIWPHGMTQVVRLRGQVAAPAAGWFAGLYARWPICAPPEFLTHSWSSAPDTFLLADSGRG